MIRASKHDWLCASLTFFLCTISRVGDCVERVMSMYGWSEVRVRFGIVIVRVDQVGLVGQTSKEIRCRSKGYLLRFQRPITSTMPYDAIALHNSSDRLFRQNLIKNSRLFSKPGDFLQNMPIIVSLSKDRRALMQGQGEDYHR